MGVSFDKVKAGDRLWDCHRTKMGNTTMSRLGAWPVDVVSIDHEKGVASVRWNGNPAKDVTRDFFRKLRRTKAKGAG